MQFNNGADVVDANRDKIGEVDRVVIDPKGGEVTHIVVRKGFFFPEDKVLPVDMVDYSDENVVRLKEVIQDADNLPNFLERDYVPLDTEEMGRRGYQARAEGYAMPLYWYPALGTTPMMWGSGYWGMYPPYEGITYQYPSELEENIPEGTIALREGAEVVDADGDKVGDIEEVLTDPKDDQVTHLVITKGLFNQHKKLIPANWIERMREDAVQLSVNAKFVDKLQDFNKD